MNTITTDQRERTLNPLRDQDCYVRAKATPIATPATDRTKTTAASQATSRSSFRTAAHICSLP
jgi:hypothetical protein